MKVNEKSKNVLNIKCENNGKKEYTLFYCLLFVSIKQSTVPHAPVRKALACGHSSLNKEVTYIALLTSRELRCPDVN